MWCLRTRKLISAFLDRELDSPTSSSLSSHMRWCLWCRKEFHKVERGAHLARRARGIVIPPPAVGMIDQITKLPRQPETPAKKRFPPLMTLGVAAAILMALSFLTFDLPSTFWPLSVSGTVYALDFGFDAPKADGKLLDAFRSRYAGKFREFAYTGSPDPSWVPFRFKFPSRLPGEMRLKSVMVFDPRYCGSLALIFSDGTRDLYLVQQPSDRPISLTGLETRSPELCKYKATHCTLGPYRLMTWTADNLRSVVITNLDLKQIEWTVDSLKYLP